MSNDHLHTPEAVAAQARSRRQHRIDTRPTTHSGSETTDWTPGTPVRVCRSGVLPRYKGRTGWVAVVATQRFPDGRLYSEIGVTWSLANDWRNARADAWFRTDELEARLL